MYTGVFFLIEAIFYMILLMIVYFRKKIYKSKENKVYSILVIACFFELILELILDYVGPLYQVIPNISYFVARLYCAALELWLTLILCYVLIVSLCMNKKEKYIYLLRIIFIVLMIGFTTLNFLLPLNFMYDGNIAYTYGPSVNIVYITAFLYSFIGIIALLLNIKNIKDRRFIPILLFLVLGGLSSYIQMKYKGLLLATGVHAFITFFMYFTIENPDVKILEELHRAKEITDNSNEEKTMFLYDMTNDIRITNQEINLNTDKIVKELSNKIINKEYINECLKNIKFSTNKFITMTNEIFDVSRIDSATIKTYNEKYNIKTLIKEIISIYHEKIQEKNLKFRSKIASDLPEYLYGDSLGIKKVLTIILNNSIKYTNKGFVELNVNAIIKGNIARLIIEVQDSGVGIEAEKLNDIFNKSKDATDNLCEARKIITLLGGVIIPSSNYGIGTTMKIVLDQKISSNSNIKYTKLYDKSKILFIGNNESTKKIIKKVLSNTNVDLECIPLGKTAIDKIRNKTKYNLILISEDLEPLNGIEINKKLKKIQGFNTTTILITKHNEYEYNNKCLEYGFTDYLISPITKEKLFNIIQKYIK